MKQIKYSMPVLKKGPPITVIPRGSNREIEEAKQLWYVQYMFDKKQIKVKGGINKIKNDPKEKARAAEILLSSIKEDLKNGYNPNDPLAYIEAGKKDYITLSDAISEFKEYHLKHDSRPKTIATYMAKLNGLSSKFPDILLKDVSTKHLEDFIFDKIKNGKFSNNSVKSAKRIFNAFFTVMINKKYIEVNPKLGIDKKIKSTQKVEEQHVPYTDADLKIIFEYLDEKDTYCAFYCRMIYYTCIRPGEIRGLKIEHIDLENRTITIPASVKKTTTDSNDQTVDIDINFFKILENLNLTDYPSDYYLVGSTINIVGENQVGANTPYQKLMTAFKRIDNLELIKNPDLKESEKLQNKGYDLYSFKHTSNIKKFNNGWDIAQIMKANRHTTVSMTEIYLRKLKLFIDTKTVSIPSI